ncbi:TPA: hypothetical protein ACSCX2_004037 [Aeromonas veronii]|uniref:hypothetical protein n=1 Tax=Aeromonas media TaxID=651 RepID=UPI00223E9965|nr:hypothetical protein [Aeromonas media]
MSEIKIPRDECDALKAVETDLLDKLIEQCLYDEVPDALRDLQLEYCGPYVSSHFRQYANALAEYRNAKAAKKRSDTQSRARRAGNYLASAVQQMKRQVEIQESEQQFFDIDDLIREPYQFSERMSVRVSYRWRKTLQDEWASGSITFFHHAHLQPDYAMPRQNRKPSAARLAQDRQDKLFSEWEHLKKLGLQSVKQYFKEGGDGSAIPQEFQVVTDSYSRILNNYSTDFWRVQS